MDTYGRIMSRYTHHPVGKRIANHVWFHINYLDLILTKEEMDTILAQAPAYTADANIIRLDLHTRDIQLIYCPDFDRQPEPCLAYSYDLTKRKIRHYRVNPFIFHQKELMVMHDYCGFSCQDAENRTAQWKRIAATQQVDKRFYLNIGRQNFWFTWLASVGLNG